jgi:hypothetical protein
MPIISQVAFDKAHHANHGNHSSHHSEYNSPHNNRLTSHSTTYNRDRITRDQVEKFYGYVEDEDGYLHGDGQYTDNKGRIFNGRLVHGLPDGYVVSDGVPMNYKDGRPVRSSRGGRHKRKTGKNKKKRNNKTNTHKKKR